MLIIDFCAWFTKKQLLFILCCALIAISSVSAQNESPVQQEVVIEKDEQESTNNSEPESNIPAIPEVYNPTEEIAEDDPVSFPVDI